MSQFLNTQWEETTKNIITSKVIVYQCLGESVEALLKVLVCIGLCSPVWNKVCPWTCKGKLGLTQTLVKYWAKLKVSSLNDFIEDNA